METLIALAVAVVALVGSLLGWKRSADKARDAERRARRAQDMRDLENDAAAQDDSGLAARITRRGL